MNSSKSLIDLSPTGFENLIFDLLTIKKMSNIRWRTPGADGGRDIEGIVHANDFSGFQSSQKWYVECKRYSSTVDWPTVYGKVAYADSNGADVLLLCMSSNVSPAAATQIDNWNNAGRRPAIRIWPGHELKNIIQNLPDVAAKYSLFGAQSLPGKSVVDLALAMSKLVNSHYSKEVFAERAPDRMLLAAQRISELLLVRMQNIEKEGCILPMLPADLAGMDEFLTSPDRSVSVDALGVAAICSYLAALCKVKVQASVRSDCLLIAVENNTLDDIVGRYSQSLNAIAFWSDIEWEVQQGSLLLRQRE